MKKRRIGWKIAALAVLAALVGGFCYINENLKPVLQGLAGARVEAIASRAMNDAIIENAVLEGESFIQVHANESGVYLLQADSARLNALAAICANDAQKRIAELGDQGVTIPIGTVSGIQIFAGKGPKLTLRFTPVGAVTSSFGSEFASAGINQTHHRINICLTATVRVVLPGISQSLPVRAEATIAENIIVGTVPDTYTNVANEEDMLNLLPNT